MDVIVKGESKMNNKTFGFGFDGLLAIAFIVLKLCKVIDWSWLWVLAPVWIPIGLGVLIVIGMIVYAVIADAIETHKEKKLKSNR